MMYLDFEGECRLEREENAVRLTGLRLVAELPDAGGPEDGGTVVLEQIGDSSPAGKDVAVPLAAAVEQPGGRTCGGPRPPAGTSSRSATRPASSCRRLLT